MNKAGRYIIFLLIFMGLYEFFDSYCTSYYSVVVSYIEADFGLSHSDWYGVLAIASVGMLAVLGIQFLTDLVGRKPMMITVFLGMGLASFFLGRAESVAGFTAAFFFLWVFFSSDIWVIVIAEEAPAEKRGRYTYLVGFLGALGAVAIPICRSLWVTSPVSEDPGLWRGMTVLASFAVPAALLGFFMKEPSAYKREKFSRKSSGKHLMLTAPFRGHRSSMLSFVVIGFILGMAAAANSTLEVFITGMVEDPAVVSSIFMTATVGTFIFFGATGPLADRFGRRPVLTAYIIVNLVSVFAMVFIGPAVGSGSSAVVLYIIAFLLNGSFWAVFMLSKTYCVECFPTEMRGTAAGWRSFSYAAGLISGSLLSSLLASVIDLGFIFILMAALCAAVIIPLVRIFLPETKAAVIV